MLLFVTSRCNMVCSHCLSSCIDKGHDISKNNLIQAIRFTKKVNPKVILVSGGEPILHPDIIHILKSLKFEFPKTAIGLCTNGTFYNNEYLLNSIAALDITVQITHDKRFYPNAIDLKKLSRFIIDTEILQVYRYGRAIENEIRLSDRTSPLCFNMRSHLKHMGFVNANKNREQNLKFCSWGITPIGGIIISESLLCPTVGSITDSIETIENNIRNFKCTNCIYAKKITQSNTPFSSVLK
jgi:organic radical activating enzyme